MPGARNREQSWVRVSLLGSAMQLQSVHAQYVLKGETLGEEEVRRIARSVVGEMDCRTGEEREGVCR